MHNVDPATSFLLASAYKLSYDKAFIYLPRYLASFQEYSEQANNWSLSLGGWI